MEKKYGVGSNVLGKAGEFRVASELLLRGYKVFLSSVDDGIDLTLGDGRNIQIKCGQKQEDSSLYVHTKYSFNIHASTAWKKRVKYGDEFHIKPHPLKGVDIIIIWAIDDDDFYIIPADKVRGKSTITFTADHDKRTQVKWNRWLPYLNNWDILKDGYEEQIEIIEARECKQCGYKWKPLVINPSRCPECNGRWYLKKPKSFHCKRCGSNWESRMESPNWCPYCHSKLWDKEVKVIDEILIRELYEAGETLAEVSKIVGLCPVTIWNVTNRLGITRKRSKALVDMKA